MTEAEWLTVKADYFRVAHLMTERTKRLYAVASARLTPRPLPFELLDRAADVVERAADEPTTESEVQAVHSAATGIVTECQATPEGWWSPRHNLAIATQRLASAPGQEYARTVPGFLVEALGGRPHESYPSSDRRTLARRLHAALLRDLLYNPFRDIRGSRLRSPRRLRRPLAIFRSDWRTDAVVGLARGIYDDRAFERMPILADALQDAGCENADILSHCREPGVHVRGCWVVDLVLGKE